FARQVANGEGIAGAAQSQTVQKPQSISEHDPVFFSVARQPGTHVAFWPLQISPMNWMNDWPAHLVCTAASSLAHEPALFSHARNWPPPHTHTLPLHSVGHQQASARGVQRSEAARQSQPLKDAHGPVGVEPPAP